ncbi:MAG: MOSC domain-containing protein [Campylobacterales bacterium]|nr:MOSC domain-containing protein [Campylobacterales bacterium]
MEQYIGRALYIKVGKIVNMNAANKKEFVSAIKKYCVAKSYLTKTGFESDEQADKVHHGGETKAVLFYSTITYNKINNLKNINLEFDGISHFGENIVVSHADEESICVGDVLRIGEATIEVSQPREPCWKLSANTAIPEMTKLIYKNGFTGWYGRVLQEGEIKQNDEITLIKRIYPKLTIAALNRLIQNPKSDEALYEEAVKCETLGAAFKKSIVGKFSTPKPEEPDWR